MALDIQGNIHKILPQQKGESKNGAWVKQDFVIETGGKYPQKVCFTLWGDKVSSIANLNPGAEVKVSFEPSSREYNERWYTELKAWRVEPVAGGSTGTGAGTPPPPPSIDDVPPPSESDDLPF